MNGLSLSEPLWLLLPLLPLLVTLMSRSQSAEARWADAPLRPWALRGATPSYRRRGLLALAWALLALAAAGPRLPAAGAGDGARAEVELMTVVPAEQIPALRLELEEWARSLKGERVGIVAYGERAGLLLPPTHDIAVFTHYLDLGPGLFEPGEAGLAEALAIAGRALPEGGSRAVLLFSGFNAGGPEADAALGALVACGIPVHTAGADGGGMRVELVPGPSEWETFYDGAIAPLPGGAAENRTWEALYAWCLAPALVLFLAACCPPRRLGALLVLAALAPNTHADEREAFEAYQRGAFALAERHYAALPDYAARLGEGASAYRQGRHRTALEAFRMAALIAPDEPTRARALHNLGNAALRLGDPRQAADAYRVALALIETPATRDNLAVAEARLRTAQAAPAPTERRGEGRQASDYGRGWAVDEEEIPDLPGGEPGAAGGGPISGSNGGGTETWQADEQDYLAGRKKLDLVADRPVELLRGFIRHEAPP